MHILFVCKCFTTADSNKPSHTGPLVKMAAIVSREPFGCSSGEKTQKRPPAARNRISE